MTKSFLNKKRDAAKLHAKKAKRQERHTLDRLLRGSEKFHWLNARQRRSMIDGGLVRTARQMAESREEGAA